MADCPRCRFALQPDTYEGVEVLFCSTCWGHWVEPEALGKILASDEYSFSESEARSVRSSIFRHWVEAEDTPDSAREQASVQETPQLVSPPCPVCQRPMDTVPFTDDCPIEIDKCNDHGVWLDTSEVKKIQVFFEANH